jgi:ferrochelatase
VTPVGVLVMAHGTPHSLDELPAFYTEIRRGSPPPPDLLADLERRYRAIGGTSPLNERTTAQVEGIGRALEWKAPGRFCVAAGAKFASPRIADAVEELGNAGVDRMIGLVLTPHFSAASVGDYARRAQAAMAALRETATGPVDLEIIDSWYLAPGFVPIMATRVRQAVDLLPAETRPDASAIAGEAGLARWSVAWQSAGRTEAQWLGPDVRDVIAALPGTGASAVVVCPVGFVSDHLEVLYDVDIEARAVAERVGIPFARTASLNDDPEFCAVLAGVVIDVDAARA